MSYRIEYGKIGQAQAPVSRRERKVGTYAMVFFFVFLILTGVFWQEGRETLQKLLWPGDMEEITTFAVQFGREIRGGMPIGDAVEGFCREVIAQGISRR